MTAAGSGTGPRSPDVPLFELDAVSLEIDGVAILSEVTVAVPDDGITVLQGPSGAGKSTVLRLLNRLEVPTSGQVRFRGEPVEALDPLVLRRRVGMVFQRPAPFPGTVRDNLLVADPDAGDDALAAALDAADLPAGLLDRAADDLSGGESQRMCLARTLVTDPEVLLMDEPTSSLDPASRDRLEATARHLADGRRPLVWVTHDAAQADRLADHRIVLIGGRVATPDARDRYLRGTDADGGPGTSPDSGADGGRSSDAGARGARGRGRGEASHG